MRIGVHWVREQIFSDVQIRFDDLSPAHIQVFSYPPPDGQRPSEVAQKLQITKQSVNDLLGHLEELGYLTREPDPTDGRARIVRLTAKGRQVQRAVDRAAEATESRVAGVLGPGVFAQLRTGLVELSRHIDGLS
jgi:DNA-binding MarR family transcriptional regulator